MVSLHRWYGMVPMVTLHLTSTGDEKGDAAPLGLIECPIHLCLIPELEEVLPADT